MAQHTPLPLYCGAFRITDQLEGFKVFAEGKHEEIDLLRRENRGHRAEFIVKACNSHHELVKALKATDTLLNSFVRVAEVSIGAFRDINEVIKQAITRAEGE